MLKLHSNWLNILKNAWSIRLMVLAAVLTGIATGLAIAQPYLGIDPLVVAAIVGVSATVANLLGIYARIVKQAGLT